MDDYPFGYQRVIPKKPLALSEAEGAVRDLFKQYRHEAIPLNMFGISHSVAYKGLTIFSHGP